jgi:hypothetical protein
MTQGHLVQEYRFRSKDGCAGRRRACRHVEFGITEQIKVGAEGFVRLERFENGLGGITLMHE